MRKSMLIAGSAIAFLMTAASLAVPAIAHAASGIVGLPVGWTFVELASCIQLVQDGVSYVYLYPTSGGLLWSNEYEVVSAMEDPCAWGATFHVYTGDGATWQGIYYPPAPVY